MRLFISAFVCLFLWAGQADRNHAQSNSHTRAVNDRAEDKEIATLSSAAPHATSPETQKNKDNPRPWYKEPQWIAVLLTGVYVIATIRYVIVSQRTLEQISKQADIAKAQHVQMVRQEEYSRQQWNAAREQGITMREQLAEMARQTDVSKAAAEAALDAVKEMRRQNNLIVAKERAVLSVEVEPGFNHHSKLPIDEIGIRVTHYGLTSAFKARGRAGVVVSESRDRPSEFTFGLTIQDVIKSGEDFTVGVLIFPSLTQADLDNIGDERAFLHLYGLVAYEDIFGSLYQVPLWYTWKVEYVEAGTEDAYVDCSYWEPRLTVDYTEEEQGED